MFKGILVPTDGFQLAERGARAVIDLAGYMCAKVIGFVAAPKYKLQVMDDSAFAPETAAYIAVSWLSLFRFPQDQI